MKAKSFVIHLKRAEARRPHAEKLLRQLPFEPEILDAIDAQALPPETFDAVCRTRLHRPVYPFALRRTEIACFLSHRKAWRTIVGGGFDAGLIVEDDVEVDRDALERILRLAARSFHPADYLRFPQHLRDEHGPVIAEAGAVSLIAPRVPGRRMFLQLVGREAARCLLDATERFDRPVDAFLQLHWLLPVRMLAARPICVREISGLLGGTTIQAKSRPLADTLKRELARPFYRLAVHWHNKAAGRRQPGT